MARKFWPNHDPDRKRFRRRALNCPEYEIVGVSANYKVSIGR